MLRLSYVKNQFQTDRLFLFLRSLDKVKFHYIIIVEMYVRLQIILSATGPGPLTARGYIFAKGLDYSCICACT